MTRSTATGMRRLLGGSKLIALRAPANAAVGDRRSRAVGPGIEFAQYRDYEPGDDLRHLDRHVYARSGRAVVRQYHLEQRLRVSVLLDASGSMGVDPRSWSMAVEMAAVFGEAALNGSDQVRFGVVKNRLVDWGQVVSRRTALRREIDRLEAVRVEGAHGTFPDLAARTLEALHSPGMLVVISDWLIAGFTEALRSWRVRDQEIVAVQVLGAAEADGAPGPVGWLRLVDAETGEVVERKADATTWHRYRAAVADWSEEVRSAVWGVEGRWVSLKGRALVDENVIRDLRGLGLLT